MLPASRNFDLGKNHVITGWGLPGYINRIENVIIQSFRGHDIPALTLPLPVKMKPGLALERDELQNKGELFAFFHKDLSDTRAAFSEAIDNYCTTYSEPQAVSGHNRESDLSIKRATDKSCPASRPYVPKLSFPVVVEACKIMSSLLRAFKITSIKESASQTGPVKGRWCRTISS
jgi:hypothetical protein